MLTQAHNVLNFIPDDTSKNIFQTDVDNNGHNCDSIRYVHV